MEIFASKCKFMQRTDISLPTFTPPSLSSLIFSRWTVDTWGSLLHSPFCLKICTEEKKLRLWLDFRLIVSHRSSAPLKSWYCNRIEPNKSLPRRLPPKMHQLSECKFPDRKYPRFLQTQHSQVSGGLARARWAGDLYKEGSRCFDWWRTSQSQSFITTFPVSQFLVFITRTSQLGPPVSIIFSGLAQPVIYIAA